MKSEKDLVRINHILNCIEDINEILNEVSEEEFLKNKEKKYSIERLLEIIGESTNHISEETLYDADNSTPWNKIISFRNFVAHEYFRIDYTIIYKLAKNQILPLKNEIIRIKNKLENK